MAAHPNTYLSLAAVVAGGVQAGPRVAANGRIAVTTTTRGRRQAGQQQRRQAEPRGDDPHRLSPCHKSPVTRKYNKPPRVCSGGRQSRVMVIRIAGHRVTDVTRAL